ncbi:MAG: D-2-hydroxyacid dehydrogenase [Planctomycetaceae bacterium]|nr:D-2-hydroxyacid dehydrogenase [Planctomycetaceae bacterium]
MSRPQIVILDDYALNPGDLSWQRLQDLGDCTIYDRTPPADVADRIQDAEIVLTNKGLVTREAIARAPNLRYVGVMATGYNVVDIEAAAEKGIIVTNVPTYGTSSVAQMVFAHLLNLTQRVGDHSAAIHQGKWAAAADWCYWDSPLIELAGLTMGIVGFGRIGQAVAKLADAFEMKVLAVTEPVVPVPDYVRLVDLDTLFRESDAITLHCPLTPQTDRLVNRERLEKMKRTAFLINTGRGPLVDEEALARALGEQRIAGAGLDVLCQEPPPADHPLTQLENCFVTPHIAWATASSRRRLLDAVVDNVAAFLAGRTQNRVN